MRQSIIDGAMDTAARLAQRAVGDGIPPPDAINHGYVPGMHALGEHFARGQMFLPDILASAETMRAAMAVLDPELRKPGGQRPTAGVVVLGTTKGDIHEVRWYSEKPVVTEAFSASSLHAAGVASH